MRGLPQLEPGLLHVGALAQSLAWWGVEGVGRELTSMTDEHVRKVEAMLHWDRVSRLRISRGENVNPTS